MDGCTREEASSTNTITRVCWSTLRKPLFCRDPRLFARVTETVPCLLQHGIWDRETTLNVVSSFVWQRYKEDSVLDMLAELSEVDPFDPDWLYYRAELYYRRGALLEARTI